MGFRLWHWPAVDSALAKVPIIVVSGILSTDTKRKVIAMGASAVLEKPFSLADLSSLVQRHLGSSEAGPDPHANA
jgi:DNA-binding response OmpR family regulator